MTKAYSRLGYPALMPYLILSGATEFLDFIVKATGAEILERSHTPEGGLQHAAVQLDDCFFEVSEARGEWAPRPTSIHYYVRDVDEVYETFIRLGGVSLHEPEDMPYGERGAGVEDKWGNHWYLATAT